MTQERFFELVYAWKDGDITGDELYQRVFVLSNVVGRSEQLLFSPDDIERIIDEKSQFSGMQFRRYFEEK